MPAPPMHEGKRQRYKVGSRDETTVDKRDGSASRAVAKIGDEHDDDDESSTEESSTDDDGE